MKAIIIAASVLLLTGAWTHGIAALPVQAPAMDESPVIRNQRILPPAGPKVTVAQQQANRRIVLQFHYEFFDLGHHQEAARKYLAEDYRVNDPQEPSGRDNYVNYFDKTIAGDAFLASVMRDPSKRPKIKAVLAADDLVMLVFDRSIPWPKGPGRQYSYISCDMFRLAHGTIVESWFSGTPTVPATP